MTRNSATLEYEARQIGHSAVTGRSSDKHCIQVLSALVEELASNSRRMEQDIQRLTAELVQLKQVAATEVPNRSSSAE